LIGLILFFGTTIGLPWVSKQVVKILPEELDQSLGKSTLTVLDNTYLAKTTLSLEEQTKIIQKFQQLTLVKQDIPKYNILFRRSKIGPNAFALPSGDIILTDEIVNLIIDNPTSVMGVLAHELGHVHERHAMRQMIESATLGAVATALFGDVSGVLAVFPAAFVKMKYSRDMEKEADQYAIVLFKMNRLDLASLAYVFEKLGEKEREAKKEESSYWDSHPSSKERVQTILDARVK
jgi:Zn-dependent protease with chaperone function